MKIETLFYVVTLMLSISSVAVAEPNEQQLGTYKVSFDIDANYSVQIAQPIETGTINVSQMRLYIDNSTFATISITEYAEPQDSTLKVHKTLMPMKMILQEGLNASIAEDKTIDGRDGFLITSKPFVTDEATPFIVYRAMYWLDSKSCEYGSLSAGRTNVMITSTFPEDLTESLLSSLHIEKSDAA